MTDGWTRLPGDGDGDVPAPRQLLEQSGEHRQWDDPDRHPKLSWLALRTQVRRRADRTLVSL
jgi:hypothetical protein